MGDEIKIVNAEEAERIDPELPEAGWKRDEELAKRKDELEQAAEETTDQREVYRFDPTKFEPDNEILRHMDELEVDNRVPGRHYHWVYDGQNGRKITIFQRLGWVVVQGNDPECPSIKDVRGYRKIGDAILMWTNEENYQKCQARKEYKRLRQQGAIGGRLRELSDKYRDKGIYAVNPEEKNIGRGSGGSLMDAMQGSAKAQGARRTAMKGVDRQLREGTVPGMPAPGNRRG